jgi:hypothetical protein
VTHRLFNALAALSLLLCIATVALWIGTARESTVLGPVATIGGVRAHSADGETEFIWSPTRRWLVYYYLIADDAAPPTIAGTCARHWLGFGLDPSDKLGRSPRVVVPDWFLVLASLVLPSIWIYRNGYKKHRGMRGLCTNCGYDLRATPERCPECGAVPPKREIVSK